MAAVVTSLLCALIIIKPQEFVPGLAGLPLLEAVLVLALFATCLDLVWRRIHLALAPHVALFFAFVVWALLVTAFKKPGELESVVHEFAILSCLFTTLSFGAASRSGLRIFATVFLGCALLVAVVALDQTVSPRECFAGDPDDWGSRGVFVGDGRRCEHWLDCRVDPPLPEAKYICERGGPFLTHTLGGRVRYRGGLADPNEVSLMLAMALPFGLAMLEVARRARPVAPKNDASGMAEGDGAKIVSGPARLRLLPAAALLGVIGVTVVAAKSRTGLVAYLFVVGVYFIRRVGAWGVVIGSIIGPLMLLYGGRSGSEADESTTERTELLLEAFTMARRSKGIGVGVNAFADESKIGMTAHNSYTLAMAETGLVGAVLFGTMLYLAIKIPVSIWLGNHRVGLSTSRMAAALAISLCGASVGILFLSWTYEQILYMPLAASAALYAVAKHEDRRFDVRLSMAEVALVPAGIMAMLAVLNIAARVRL